LITLLKRGRHFCSSNMEGLAEHEILAGTYEAYLLAYRIVKSESLEDEGEEWQLKQSFNVRDHSGAIRCVAAGSKFAISGGSDDSCKIYDMIERRELGTLQHHDGIVTCMATQPPSHLLSASDDNSLAITRMGSWQVEKTLYKHNAGISALAMHPTGKLCFTAGKDKKLITWNLVKARPAFITNIKGIAEFITVSPDGTRYAVGVHRRVDIYSIESAGIEYSIDMKAKPNCLVFLDNDTVVVGGESKEAQVHSLIEKSLLKSWDAHQTRIRALHLLSPSILVTASSCDHSIKVWGLDTDRVSPVRLLCSVDTGCRVTCLSAWHPGLRNKGAKKRSAEAVSKSPLKKVKLAEEKKASSVAPQTVTVEEEITEKPKKEKLKKKKKKKVSLEGAAQSEDLTAS